MPGYLSQMFADDQGQSGQSSDGQAQLDYDTDLAYEATVGTDVGVTYQDGQGGTHSYSATNDVTLNVDADATVGAVVGYDQSSMGG